MDDSINIIGRISNASEKDENAKRKEKFKVIIDDDSDISETLNQDSNQFNHVSLQAEEEEYNEEDLILIVKRLTYFARERYGSKSVLIKKIGLSKEDAISFFSYKKPLSKVHLERLEKIGCDVNWLLTGKILNPKDMKTEPLTKIDFLQGYLKSNDNEPSEKNTPIPETPKLSNFSQMSKEEIDLSNEVKELTYENHILKLKIKEKENQLIQTEKEYLKTIQDFKDEIDDYKIKDTIYKDKLEKIILELIEEIKKSDANVLKNQISSALEDLKLRLISSIEKNNNYNLDKIYKILDE